MLFGFGMQSKVLRFYAETFGACGEDGWPVAFRDQEETNDAEEGSEDQRNVTCPPWA